MRPPCEQVVAKDYLPLIRKKVIEKLLEDGYNQNKIAEMMGLSQPRISQYMSAPDKLENIENDIKEVFFSEVTETALKISTMLEEGKNHAETIPTICATCRKMRVAGPMCKIHLAQYQTLAKITPQGCNACHWNRKPEDVQYITNRQQLLIIMEEIILQLTALPSFIEHIPEIGAQLVMMNPDDIPNFSNIAGFPGRIVRVKDRAQAVSKPEYGESRTVSKLLITLRKYNNIPFVICITLKTSQKLITLLQNQKTFPITKTTNIDNNYEELCASLHLEDSERYFAIIDSGSIGIEPISYLFFTDKNDFKNFWGIIPEF